MLLLLMQLFFVKRETKQSERQNATNFCTRMRYESRVVGSADSANTWCTPLPLSVILYQQLFKLHSSLNSLD
jgi:hypothetical protein